MTLFRLIQSSRDSVEDAMRSFNSRMVLCSLMVLLTARPAHAWWEFLDYLSGPGPFYGQDYGLRVWCHGRKVPLHDLDSLVATTVIKTYLATDIKSANEAIQAWTDVVTRLEEILDIDKDKHRLIDKGQFASLKKKIDELQH